MISNYFRRGLLKKLLLWALVVETTLFVCGVYTGAISSGPHDPLAVLFAISQVPGIILMGPVTLVLSEILAERRVNMLVWTGVFLIQTVWLAILFSGLILLKDRIRRKVL